MAKLCAAGCAHLDLSGPHAPCGAGAAEALPAAPLLSPLSEVAKNWLTRDCGGCGNSVWSSGMPLGIGSVVRGHRRLPETGSWDTGVPERQAAGRQTGVTHIKIIRMMQIKRKDSGIVAVLGDAIWHHVAVHRKMEIG